MRDTEIIEKLCKERNEWQGIACRTVSVLRQVKFELEQDLDLVSQGDFQWAFREAIAKLGAADPGEIVSVGYGSGEKFE